MTYVWIGFFVLVAALLALDLGVLNREHHVIGFKEASRWTAFWITLGVSFGGLVYLIYENHWFGVSLAHQSPLVSDGVEALTGFDPGLILTGSAFAIVLAYGVRFFAIAQGAADFAAQADPDADTDGLLERYPGAVVSNFDGQPGITEMDALIAYLQVLGTLVDFSTFQPDASR